MIFSMDSFEKQVPLPNLDQMKKVVLERLSQQDSLQKAQEYRYLIYNRVVEKVFPKTTLDGVEFALASCPDRMKYHQTQSLFSL
jgi:hypothetical protein